jgi:hypothetical protein
VGEGQARSVVDTPICRISGGSSPPLSATRVRSTGRQARYLVEVSLNENSSCGRCPSGLWGRTKFG